MVRTYKALLLVTGLFAAGTLSGATVSRAAFGKGREVYADLDVLAQVFTNIELNYVSPVQPAQMIHDAIRGVVSGLDPHSVFLDAEAWDRLDSRHSDPLGLLGLGLEEAGPGGSRVSQVVPGSPAAAVGIAVGDRLISVEGQDVTALPLESIAALLEGPQGEPVLLGLQRDEQRLELRPVRDQVIAPAVEADLFAPGWGYARLISFRQRSAAELRRALTRLDERGGEPLRGLVLDLRDNPGGSLDEAISIADLFLSDGPIASTRGRNPTEDRDFNATSSPDDRRMPLVVLVNGGSASASELLAGALRDRARASLVGERTYGKGSSQRIYTFVDGSALKLTVARYWLPGGETIADRDGLTPDVEVTPDSPDTPESRLRAALSALPAAEAEPLLADLDLLAAQSEQPVGAALPWTGTLQERLEQDRQLATAWRALRGQGR